jgi:hypothetical protein
MFGVRKQAHIGVAAQGPDGRLTALPPLRYEVILLVHGDRPMTWLVPFPVHAFINPN